MSDKTDLLQKRLDIISKIFMILIPFILFYFGNEIKKNQDRDNKEQQNLNRIATLLKSLSSNNLMERKLAIKFSEYLADKGNFPNELSLVIEEIHSSDTVISKDAGNVLELIKQQAIADNNTGIANQIDKNIAVSPSRVYIQTPKGNNLDQAKGLLITLKKEGYNMLGIEQLNYVMKQNELRYFKKQDIALANDLAGRINKIGNYNIVVKYISGYEKKIKSSQLEIWLK